MHFKRIPQHTVSLLVACDRDGQLECKDSQLQRSANWRVDPRPSLLTANSRVNNDKNGVSSRDGCGFEDSHPARIRICERSLPHGFAGELWNEPASHAR